MHQKLADILEKEGIKNVQELSVEEKDVFDRWNAILSEGEVTVEKIATFCKNQMKHIEARWKNFDIDQQKKSELIPYHAVYSMLYDIITIPRAERENLEKQLDIRLRP